MAGLVKNIGLVTQLKNWLTNSKPNNTELAKRLEQEHKSLFLFLVDATNFYLNLQRLNAAGKLSTAQRAAMVNYLAKGLLTVNKWKAQQAKLESIGVKKFSPTFFNLSAQKELNTIAEKIRSGLSGENDNDLGVAFLVPLIWFGVVSVAGWSATTIVDMLTTTAQEQEQLMNATKQTALDLGLNSEQAAALLTQNNAAVDNSILPSGGGSILLIAGIGLALFLFTNRN